MALRSENMITPKKPPYWNTKADVEHSQSSINKLLQKYGVTDYQWTTAWSQNKVMLKCVLEEQNGKKLMLLFEPPDFQQKHKSYNSKTGRTESIDAPNWAASLRFLYNRLKNKLESVAYGGIEMEQEFMPNILVRDAEGHETTLGKMLEPAIQKNLLAEGSLDIAKVLPTPKPDMRDNAVDAEGRVDDEA